ncbi:MAG: single-stranded-DNA-specific exonuclease RecJ [Hyphomicrobiaceae bacterium]
MSALPNAQPIRFEVREHFLGVSQSARDLAWFDRLPASADNLAAAISQRLGLPELLGRILAARGIGLDDVADVMDPRLKNLMPDPGSLRDVATGAERLGEAIVARQQIAIFGDYDVDGASSSALMSRFLSAHGLEPRIYIPDRMTEGYGPNPTAIEMLIDEGAELIVTVDCGTTSETSLAAARARGIDVVVIDHHQADEALPQAAAIVNPNRQDDLSGLGDLCAAGVVFLVLVATVRALRTRNWYRDGRTEPSLLEWLDLVALATVCDVVPLTGLNRAFVVQGLQVMRMRRNTGLRALADVAGLTSPPNTYHLGFVLGPRINAGGRIGDAALGSKLLSCDDELEAGRIAELLDRLNRERKAMEDEILQTALVEAEMTLDAEPDLPLLVAGSEDWHKGLVGLVASRLTERFSRPSMVIAWDRGSEGTGSLRSVGGADIGSAVRAAVSAGLLIKGGGHTMAAGVTISRDKLEDVRAFLIERLQSAVDMARDDAGLEVDGALTAGAVTKELVDLIERAGPYGAGNPTPRFVFPAHYCNFAKIVGEAHVRCSLVAGDKSRLSAIAFRAATTPVGDALLNSGGLPLHVLGHLKKDTWRGRERIDLIIDDVAKPSEQGR